MRRALWGVLGGAVLATCTFALRLPATAPSRTEEKQSTKEPSAGLPEGATMNAELRTSLDAKKAKEGDKVEAYTTEAVKFGGEVILPRGTKLLGHVTQAAARAKGDDRSALAIQFDKAVVKKDQEMPLSVKLVAIAAAEREFSGMTPSNSDPMADRGAAAAGGSPMGAARPQPPPSNVPSFPAADADAAKPGAGGPLAPDSRGVYGLRDLQLLTEAASTGEQNAVITSSGKDVRLDSGTRLLLLGLGLATAKPPSK